MTVAIVVRNDGEGPAENVGLTNEVSQSAAVRSASAPDSNCGVSSRRAECQLGTVAPGESVSTTVRLLMDQEPASSVVTQRITLTTGGQPEATERGVSTLIDPEQASALPFDGPETTVTLIALVSFVLAAKSGPTSPR